MKSYDPRMHTAEHILNQTMCRMFGCDRSFSNHIEKKKSKCDYHFERPLSVEEEMMVEDTVNEVIDQNLSVDAKMISIQEAEKQFNLSRLPEGVGETLRIVTVGDYDACPCIGLHVKNSGEIGAFKLISTSWEEGILRIRFKLSE